MKKIAGEFTAVYKKSRAWYVGWIEEVPGVNSQGKTLGELKENLEEALTLVLETNRSLALREAGRNFRFLSIAIPA